MWCAVTNHIVLEGSDMHFKSFRIQTLIKQLTKISICHELPQIWHVKTAFFFTIFGKKITQHLLLYRFSSGAYLVFQKISGYGAPLPHSSQLMCIGLGILLSKWIDHDAVAFV